MSHFIIIIDSKNFERSLKKKKKEEENVYITSHLESDNNFLTMNNYLGWLR